MKHTIDYKYLEELENKFVEMIVQDNLIWAKGWSGSDSKLLKLLSDSLSLVSFQALSLVLMALVL